MSEISDLEKLKLFSDKQGFDWAKVSANIQDGDAEAAVKQLMHAKSNKSRYDMNAVKGWLVLCQAGKNNGRK